MTREEQTRKAADDYCGDDAREQSPCFYAHIHNAFLEGAEWADAHPHWIPVEEELPKERGWYLVATPTLNSKIDVALWDGKWFRLITITHWMPLPKAPRKEE